MNFQYWRTLAITSIKEPASAARTLMAMGFDAAILWNALVLVAIGNTLLNALTSVVLPGSSPLPGLFDSPFLYFIIVAGALSLTALSIFWVGQRMGGTGTMANVLVLVVWLQALRLAVQVAVLVLVLVAPLFSALLVFAAALVGVYILVHFVDQAHGFKSTGKSAVVLIAALLAIVVGLSLLLTVVGGLFGGMVPHV